MAEAFTYAPVGVTRTDQVPPAYAQLRERRQVGPASAFEPAAEFVLGFGMQRGVGIRVSAVGRARPGLDVLMHLGVGPVRLIAPTRVVYVIDEPDRRGFAYGTLPGHPESGEELFLVERIGEATYAEVRAVSRPGRWYVAAGGPVVRLVQRWFARRYLAVLAKAMGG